jgi:hypothetical protein
VSTTSEPDIPAPLVVAVSLAGLEGVLLALYGVMELFNLSQPRVTMGLTTAIFFLVYGGLVLFCAWSVYRGQSWARSPLVMAQLIQLGVAVSFWGHGTTLVSIFLGVVAVLALVGFLHPASLDALSHDD